MFYLKWLVFFIVVSGTSISAFLAGYTVGKKNPTEEQLTRQDILSQIQSLQSVSSKELAQLTKKLEEIIAKSDKISQSLDTITCQSSNQVTTQSPLSSLEVSKDTNISSKSETMFQQEIGYEGSEKEWLAKIGQETIRLIDYQKLPILVENLFKGQKDERIEAINAIGRVASPEVKQALFNMLQDENEDLAVRLTAIYSLDWHSDATVLINTFRTTDNQDIKGAILVSAVDTDFTPEMEITLEQNFEEIYRGDSEESMKLSIMEFFLAKNPAKVQALLVSVPTDKFSPELREHIEFIQSSAKQRLQTQSTSD